MKNLKYYILFTLVILLSVLCVVIPIVSAYFFLENFLTTGHYNIFYLLPSLLILLSKPLFEARIKLRNIVDYDEFGVSK